MIIFLAELYKTPRKAYKSIGNMIIFWGSRGRLMIGWGRFMIGGSMRLRLPSISSCMIRFSRMFPLMSGLICLILTLGRSSGSILTLSIRLRIRFKPQCFNSLLKRIITFSTLLPKWWKLPVPKQQPAKGLLRLSHM